MVLLEVERKFTWKLANLKPLLSNSGHPRFSLIQEGRATSFREVYYDCDDKLSHKGLWVRERTCFKPSVSASEAISTMWEAKQATSQSSFTHSACEEVNDTCRIQQMINEHIPGHHSSQCNFGLKPTCDFETFRRTFLADNRFTIVLDQTDFGHSIGEVELLAQDAKKAHEEMEAFLNRYKWFFDCSRPKGKLTAYFERFKSDGAESSQK